MLSSVLYIVAKPLDHALRSYQKQYPKAQEVEPLLQAINENLAVSRRTGSADHTELEVWCGMHVAGTISGSVTDSGLTAAVRHTVQGLVQWAQQPPLTGMPAAYTHRQTLVAVKMLGAKRVLAILLEELKSYASDPAQAGIAYDVVTAIICAPDVTNDRSLAANSNSSTNNPADNNNNNNNNPSDPNVQQPSQQNKQQPPQGRGRLSLCDALKYEADDWKELQKNDPLMTETVVRLYRRVEAQMALPPPGVTAAAAAAAAAMLQPPELGALGVSVGVGGEMALDQMEGMVLDGAGLGTGLVGVEGGMEGLVGGLGVGSGIEGLGVGGGAGDDIFGGLPGAGEFGGEFAGWEGMDLS